MNRSGISFPCLITLQLTVVSFPKSQSQLEEPEQQLAFSDTQFHAPPSITYLWKYKTSFHLKNKLLRSKVFMGEVFLMWKTPAFSNDFP